MIKKFKLILASIMLLAGIVTTYHAFDTYVAKAEDIQQIRKSILKLNQRIDKRSDFDAARDIQRRIWDLEAEYKKNPPMPESVKREIELLRQDRERLLDKWIKPN